jgi:hypothetical protein
LVKSHCDSRGVGFFSKGDEGVKVKGGAHKPLPPPNGIIRQFKRWNMPL